MELQIPKVLSIEVRNCDTYKVEANWGGVVGDGRGSLGVAMITFEGDVFEGKNPLVIKLSADGMQEEKLSVEVNFTKVQASDLVYFWQATSACVLFYEIHPL